MVSHAISVEVRPLYLIIRAEGTLTASVDRKLDLQTAEACRVHKRSRVLVDISRMTGAPTTLEDYDAASTLDKRWRDVVERAAILDSPEFATENHFFETVALNRGYIIKTFTREDHAIEWLLGDLPVAATVETSAADTVRPATSVSGSRWLSRWF